MTAPLLTSSKVEFINRAIKASTRCDGRKSDEFRKLTIHYGNDLGSVFVALGNTKVIARISAEIGTSSPVRPNEGVLRISTDMNQISTFSKTYAKRLEQIVLLARYLEHIFVESRCLDMESLCIISELHVWVLNLNVTVLSDDGSLRDACSIAALAALMHYRRPEAAIEDGKVRVFKASEKEPIQLSLRHYPSSVTYCFFADSRSATVDPTWSEERASETQLALSYNTFGEICGCHLAGKSTTAPLILKYEKTAISRAKHILKRIRHVLAIDESKREKKQLVGFITLLQSQLEPNGRDSSEEMEDFKDSGNEKEDVKDNSIAEIVPAFKDLSTKNEPKKVKSTNKPVVKPGVLPLKKSEWPSLDSKKKRR